MMPSISELIRSLYTEYALTPVMAAELECYVMLPDTSPQGMDRFWSPVEKAIRHEGIPLIRIEKERGEHQYELVTGVMEPEALAYALSSMRAIIEKYAARYGIETSFAAKPFSDEPSSGMHIHLHLADDDGINAYHKTDEWMSDTLRYSLGGLLESMAQDMPVFFPEITDYARLNDADHVPKIFGWGVNNRYCALRIPAIPDFYDKRIEHRVPCANADPMLVIAAILKGVMMGLRTQIEPPPQQYGKKSDKSVKALALTSFCE
jgi:glutamine synthetase